MIKVSRFVSILISVLFLWAIIGLCVLFRYKIAYDFSNIQIEPKNISGISIMTYNVKCNENYDFGKTGWYYRAKYVAQNIEENQATIICLQEVKTEQYEFFKNCLKGYSSVVLFRDNSWLTESTPIFYKNDCFELVSSESFWLSDTPYVQSNTWDGAYTRVCSSVILKEKATQKQFAVFNTHLDHVSQVARSNGLNLIKSKIEAFSLPALVTGDMNTVSSSSEIISFKNNFDDLGDIWGESGGTFSGGAENHNAKIDFIFKSKNQFQLLNYKTISKTFNGVYASDHFPIYAELEL